MADALGLQREMIEVIDSRDFARLRELYHPDYEYWGSDGTTGGIDVGVGVAETYLAAFPDMTFSTAHETNCGDVAITEFIARGTHQGELAGIPATGKAVEVQVCNIVEVRDGKIWREREYFDQLGLMQQLGVVPTD